MKKTFTYRMDEEKKKKFDAMCESLGMNTATAINLFVSAFLNQKKIPFELEASSEEDSKR